MPGGLSLHDDVVGGRVEPCANGLDDFLGDPALDPLPLAVLGVEPLGQPARFVKIPGPEEPERVGGCFEASTTSTRSSS